MPTAQISLTVTTFNDLSAVTAGSRCTVVGNPVLTPDPSINGKVSIVGSTIVTTGQAAIDLEFTILQDPSLPADTYTPLGIAYKQTAVGAGAADPGGAANFDPPDLSQKGNKKITINNKRVNKGGAAWNFFILIQNSSGALGLIDPGIQNDN